jgi:predicted cupin superfamily sugar epimerase
MTVLPLEGTFYVKTYQSESVRADGTPDATAILALYSDEPRSCSLFHKLIYDEVWHFHAGDPIRLFLLYPDKTTREVILGNDLSKNQLVQFVVPKGVWQAGEIVPGGQWGLFGCTMAPGFNSQVFEGGKLSDLIEDYPERKAEIERLAMPAVSEKYFAKDFKD